ncbi:hypothetical protein MKW98_007210 [Papaver atlanticum]|uniref:Uncharacterized protein n=1 Tax=Papaver atlanticum TaxID=357466 RepID=A0AAD4XIB8_9MAGN|nr:hypothetical protein MKW98_007210 [Papaver atlanticum]
MDITAKRLFAVDGQAQFDPCDYTEDVYQHELEHIQESTLPNIKVTVKLNQLYKEMKDGYAAANGRISLRSKHFLL